MKSCATPPANEPSASSFCACRSCSCDAASALFRSTIASAIVLKVRASVPTSSLLSMAERRAMSPVEIARASRVSDSIGETKRATVQYPSTTTVKLRSSPSSTSCVNCVRDGPNTYSAGIPTYTLHGIRATVCAPNRRSTLSMELSTRVPHGSRTRLKGRRGSCGNTLPIQLSASRERSTMRSAESITERIDPGGSARATRMASNESRSTPAPTIARTRPELGSMIGEMNGRNQGLPAYSVVRTGSPTVNCFVRRASWKYARDQSSTAARPISGSLAAPMLRPSESTTKMLE